MENNFSTQETILPGVVLPEPVYEKLNIYKRVLPPLAPPLKVQNEILKTVQQIAPPPNYSLMPPIKDTKKKSMFNITKGQFKRNLTSKVLNFETPDTNSPSSNSAENLDKNLTLSPISQEKVVVTKFPRKEYFLKNIYWIILICFLSILVIIALIIAVHLYHKKNINSTNSLGN